MQRLKIASFAVPLVIAGAAVLAWTTLPPLAAQQSAATPAVAPQWEYKITDVDSESYLNQLGKEGWELCESTCQISTTARTFGGTTYSHVTSKNRLILKRPRR
jgi:hypothetical protein